MNSPPLSELFAEGSPLHELLAGFRPRAGQLDMAEAVARALDRNHSLLVEAGTGTGKTLAYLVPAALSRRRVVVSTATKALQDQLYFKDVPLVRALLEPSGVPVRVVLMKGLSNYVCRRRLREALGARGDDRGLVKIEAWSKTTETGDRSELGSLPEDDPAWIDVVSGSDTRIGPTCPHYDDCFVTAMREAAEDADVIIVNHHLYCADLALRRTGRGEASVLPAHDAVIFDEVQRLEDVATTFFGRSVSSARIDSLVGDARRAYAFEKATGPARPVFELVLEAGRRMFGELERVAPSASDRSRRLLGARELGGDVHREWIRLDTCLEGLARTSDRTRPAEAQIARRATELRAALAEIFEAAQEPATGRVPWIERGSARPTITVGYSPTELGPELAAMLFDGSRAVIGTSATLTTQAALGRADFSFVKERLGAHEADELVVPSPFDYPSRAGFYVARDLPEPQSPEFDEAAAERALELVRISGGGAFVLCTSNRAMNAFYNYLRGRAPVRVLRQGERSKTALLDEFRADGHAVLVATMSFWEGVDVVGEALRMVVMDKLPFPVPTDPVVVARSQALEERGESSFRKYSLPMAAITLKQGFGRLLRSERDAGVVALLDRRILAKSYGRLLLDALPPATRLRSIDDVRRFWESIFPGSAAPVFPDAVP